MEILKLTIRLGVSTTIDDAINPKYLEDTELAIQYGKGQKIILVGKEDSFELWMDNAQLDHNLMAFAQPA